MTEPASPQHSVKSKLLLAVMITTLAALAVAATGIMLYELRTYEASRANELAAFADLLGAATGPALAFNDRREAEDSLALLRVRPSIVAGALYDAAGRLFAAHQPDVLAGIKLPPPGSSLHDVVDDRMILARPIVEKGETVGSLILVARYEARERLDTEVVYGTAMIAQSTEAVRVLQLATDHERSELKRIEALIASQTAPQKALDDQRFLLESKEAELTKANADLRTYCQHGH